MASKTWAEDGRKKRSGDDSSTKRVKRIIIEYEDVEDKSERKKPTVCDVLKKQQIKQEKFGREFSRKVWGMAVGKNSHRSDDVSSTKSKTGTTSSKSNRWRF